MTAATTASGKVGVYIRIKERRMKPLVAAVAVLVALVAGGLVHAQQDGLTPEVTDLSPNSNWVDELSSNATVCP